MTEFRYAKPATLAEATALLVEAKGNAAVLAGGTDLLVALRSGSSRPTLVVDIKGIAGMDQLRWSPAGDLILGAAVEVQRICQDERILRTFPSLAEGAGHIGSLQIRYRATLGGNLANASPCMDTAPPLLVLGARVTLAGPKGEREVPLQAFFIQVKRTVLAADEILTSITVPKPAPRLRSAFEKTKRVWGHDLALVNAAGAYDPDAGTFLAAVGSCGITPVLFPALSGIDPARLEETIQRLRGLTEKHLCPIDDVRASAEYRREMAALLMSRLAERLLGHGPRRS